MVKELGVAVFADNNANGSMFTQDRNLGHGLRAVRASDKKEKPDVRPGRDTWMVPFEGTATFKKF
jgi:hypothetical protein